MRLIHFTFPVLAVLSQPILAATSDSVILTQGDELSGDLISMDQNGSISFQSPLSEDLLTIRPKAVSRVTFKTSKVDSIAHKEKLTLANGDQIPCTLLSLDEKNITFDTWYAGKFTISRDQVRKLRFDNKPDSILYQGFQNLSKWEKHDGWKNIENGIRIAGTGIAANKYKLPQNFIIEFELEWTGNSPRFKLHFCGENNTTAGYSDRYFLDFNTAGLQLTHATAQRFNRIGFSQQNIVDLKKKRVNIQVRVDKKNQQIGLSLDGKDLGTFDAPSVSVPRGGYLVFESNTRNVDTMTVKDFRIIESAGTSPTSEEIKQPKKLTADSLEDIEGDVYTGTANKIIRDKDKLSVEFTSKHQKEPLIAPSDRIASLSLQNTSDAKIPASHYWSELNGGGTISFSSIAIKPDSILADHPILGKCTLKREAIHFFKTSSSD